MNNKKLIPILTLFMSASALIGCAPKKDPGPIVDQKATITVNNGTGGGEYVIGTEATITATVPEHQKFVNWTVDGLTIAQNPYTFTVTKDETYTAHFEMMKYTVTVINGNGSGTFDYGSTVTVTPKNEDGKEFKEWQVDGQKVSESSNYSFTLTDDIVITAIYDTVHPLAKYTSNLIKKAGKDFKILNFTDIQLHDGNTTDVSFAVIEQLIAKEEPDMITFLGDLLQDNRDYRSVENPRKIINKLDSYGIPWAPIFGNHDWEDYQTKYDSMKTTTSSDLVTLFENSDYCLFKVGPSNVSGKSNYIVNIIDETTQKPVESLYFMDSRLSGLDDSNVDLYREEVAYSKELNDGEDVPSVLYTHIPLIEYGDAYEASMKCEYRNIVGSINRNPTDLASGTRKMFPAIKELGTTSTVICGHDHENAYYTVHDGIKLVYSMKSSDGDDYHNIAQLGGTVLKLDGNTEDVYFTHADVALNITESTSINPDTLPYWRYSGAKVAFDVELPNTGSINFNLQGTNTVRGSVTEKDRYGAWNRLTNNATINAATKSIDMGTMTRIEGNKYHVEVAVTDFNLNKSGGETAYGDETARLIFFNSVTGTFKVNNIHYEFEEVTETDQIDLADAVISDIPDQFSNKGMPVKPEVTVTLGGNKLQPINDILVKYENNIVNGTATVTVVPSALGAHKYKGSVNKTFAIVDNPFHGERFTRGFSKALGDIPLTETFEFDVRFDTESSFNFFLGDGWADYFGYYEVKSNGTLGENYQGMTIRSVGSDYYRVTCVLSQLNKTNGGNKNPTEKINLFYIHGSWGQGTPSGYIDFNIA